MVYQPTNTRIRTPVQPLTERLTDYYYGCPCTALFRCFSSLSARMSLMNEAYKGAAHSRSLGEHRVGPTSLSWGQS